MTSPDRVEASVLAVIQARMGSTRLPGKVLRPIVGRSTLGWVVRAAQAAAGIGGVVVATSTAPDDDALAAHAAELGALVVRGDEEDVLGRYVAALDAFEPDAVVRLTADCPFLDPDVLAAAVATWRANPTVDYVSTILVRTLPRGLDVEVVAAEALRRVGAVATAHHRSHVTSYVYSHPEEFSLLGLVFGQRESRYRVTLDTAEDAEVIDAVASALGDRPPPWREVVRWLDEHPEVAARNSGVEQKLLEQG